MTIANGVYFVPKFDRENSQLSKYQEFKITEFLVFFLAKAVELQCEAVKKMLKEAFREEMDSTTMLNFANR